MEIIKMKAICIKKVESWDSDNPYHIPIRIETLEIKEFNEKEFGIIFHDGKYKFTEARKDS